jgi:hypothetical protein
MTPPPVEEQPLTCELMEWVSARPSWPAPTRITGCEAVSARTSCAMALPASAPPRARSRVAPTASLHSSSAPDHSLYTL